MIARSRHYSSARATRCCRCPTATNWKRRVAAGPMVALDFYVTETTAHCDYVLPVTTMYERDDFAVTFQTFQATPFRQATEAVVAPAGRRATEWEIIDELVARMAGRTPVFAVLAARSEAVGLVRQAVHPASARRHDDPDVRGRRPVRPSPRRADISPADVEQHPHGEVVAPHIRTGVLGEVVVYRHGRVRLETRWRSPPRSPTLSRRSGPADFPMRMIGMREPRSENSWMHNAPLLMRGERIHRAAHACRRRRSAPDRRW